MNAWAAVNVGEPAPNPCDPPLVVSIDGPALIFPEDCETWSSIVSGGTGSYSYNWYLEDNWQTSSTYYYDCFFDIGIYEIRLDVVSGSQSDSDWLYLIVADDQFPPESPFSTSTEIIAYPNPTSDYFTVSVTDDELDLIKIVGKEKYYLYMTNSRGEILFMKRYYGVDLNFDTSNLIDGIYSIVLVNKNLKVASVQVIIKH